MEVGLVRLPMNVHGGALLSALDCPEDHGQTFDVVGADGFGRPAIKNAVDELCDHTLVAANPVTRVGWVDLHGLVGRPARARRWI